MASTSVAGQVPPTSVAGQMPRSNKQDLKEQEFENKFLTKCWQLMDSEKPNRRPLSRDQVHHLHEFTIVLHKKGKFRNLGKVKSDVPLRKRALEEFIAYFSKPAREKDVILNTGELVKESNNKRLKSIVVGYEDSFDILLKIHKENDHCGYTDMLKRVLIDYDYFTSRVAVLCFLQVCDGCDHKNDFLPKTITSPSSHVGEGANDTANQYDKFVKTSLPSYHKRGYVELLTMPYNDNFRHLLVYLDVQTCYVLLRPIQIKTEHDIAAELFKIFADFGAPQIISIGDMFNKPLRHAIKALERYDLHVEMYNTFEPHSVHQTHVLEMVYDWAKSEKDSRFWAVQCYTFQHNLNRTNTDGVNSAFMAKFDRKVDPWGISDDVEDTNEAGIELARLDKGVTSSIELLYHKVEEFVRMCLERTQYGLDGTAS